MSALAPFPAADASTKILGGVEADGRVRSRQMQGQEGSSQNDENYDVVKTAS